MPPTADAGAVLAREQATEAAVLWAVGDFDAAQQTLQRLEATLPSDARVQLNLWVAGYYADASSSLDSVAKELAAWLAAHPSDPGDDVTQHNTHAVAAVNYGLILFLQQQHASALAVLEPLFEHVDTLQDGTALCLCVLLLEIYLDSCQLPKAVDLLQYLQGLCTPALSLLLGAGQEGSEAVAGGAGAGSSSSKGSGLTSADRSPRKQQHQQDGPQEARAVAAAGRGDGSRAGQDGAVVPLDQALPNMSKTKGTRMAEVFELVQQQGGKAPGHDLAPLLHLYKARLALACNNHKAAKKEVRGMLSCDPDSAAALLLKAQLETCRQQPKKALKTLGPLLTAQHQHTIRCRLQLLNLLAAVHHQLDKHHLAALYLTTALDLHSEAQQQQKLQAPAASKPQEPPQQTKQAKWNPKKLWQQKGRDAEGGGPQAVVSRQSHALLQDMSDALSYNLGLQQLALQDWQAAMECFEAASSKYFTLPQLWLRWAEACIGLYHQQQQKQQQQGLVAGQQEADGSGSSGGGAPSTGQGAAKQGKGQQQGQGKKQQQPQQQPQKQEQQQQQDCNPEQLLEQAAAHISTGLLLLQEQQAAAAKQLEAATAAAAAAIAAGEPPPELVGQPLWPTASSSSSAAAGARDGGTAAGGAVLPGAASNSAETAGPSSSSGAAVADSAGASTPTVAAAAAAGLGGAVLSSWPAEASLLAPELAAVRQSLLANRAYVALLQGQLAEALSAAQELLACSCMSPAQHYLGSSYAAEALCHMGRVEDAQQLLQAHMQLFMPNSSSSAVSLSGLPTDHQHQQQAQLGLSLAGPAGTAAGGVPESSSSASALGVAAAGMHGAVGGVAGAPGAIAQLAHTTAGSTKSFDGSCISCPRGACGASGTSAAGPGLGPREQALLLHNMSTVLVLQGDYQEGSRHAALAAELLYTSAAQQGPAAGAQPFPQAGL